MNESIRGLCNLLSNVRFRPLPMTCTWGEFEAATPAQRQDYMRRLLDQWDENDQVQQAIEHQKDQDDESQRDWTR